MKIYNLLNKCKSTHDVIKVVDKYYQTMTKEDEMECWDLFYHLRDIENGRIPEVDDDYDSILCV